MNQDFDILNSFKKRRSFIVVCAIALFYAIGAGALWFLLPTIAEKFTGDITLVAHR